MTYVDPNEDRTTLENRPYLPPWLEQAALDARPVADAALPARLGVAALNATIDNKVGAAFYGYETRIAPTGFTLRVLPLPVVKHLGYAKFAFDAATYIAPYKPAAGVTYYISPTGTSGNSGLTSGLPTTAASAAGKSDVGTVMVAPGEYFRNTGFPLLTKNLNVLGTGAKPSDTVITGFENPTLLTWTLNTGNIYQTTRSTTIAVVDKRTAYVDANGDWSMYEQKADLASITAAGQWAISGSTVYVWPLGNVNLATDASFMRLSLNTGTGPLNINGGNTLYGENFITEGGGGPTVGGIGAFSSGGTGGVPRLILVDVLAKYCIANGITTTGAEFGIFIRSGAAVTGADGLNHHSGTFGSTTYYPDILEIDPTSYNNGRFTTVETQNAVTTHDSIKAVRVGGTIGPSFGPIMGEDGAGTKSWNMGCKLKKSTAVIRNYAVAATSGAEIWLDECIDEGGSIVTVYADNGSKIHTRNMVNGSSTKLRSKILDTSTLDTY